MTNEELIEQNTAIRRSMADASCLLDRAYGSSGERLELRLARLIKVEARLRRERASLLHALRLAQADVCSLHCPNIKKTGEEWTHSERCKAISQAIAKAERS